MPRNSQKKTSLRSFLIQQLHDQIALGRTIEGGKAYLLQVFEEAEIDAAINDFLGDDASRPNSRKANQPSTEAEPKLSSLKPIRLSKSQYIVGRKCLKRVWLYNYRKDLADNPSESQMHLFAQGNEVGTLARDLFKDGRLVDEGYDNLEGAIAHTKELLADASIPAIFEATFQFEDVLIRIDVLRKNSDESFDVIEVKSTNSVKKEHHDDIAIQKFVLQNLGLKIGKSYLMHLNPDFKKTGALKLSELFILEECDESVAQTMAEIPKQLDIIRAELKKNSEPQAPIGSVCKTPYECEFRSYCWAGVESDSIHKLARITDKKRYQLTELGIDKLKNIPEVFELSDLQSAQVKSARVNAPVIDESKIISYLNSLRWPLHFLDFETISFAIPRYEGTSPYQQLPFQFSLHIQREVGSPLEHVEFLHKEDSDPRADFVESLLRSIDGDSGSIIVYHSSFERGITIALGQIFPELTNAFEEIATRLWDLENPFAKQWYCDSKISGSSSIKNVLPVLVPSLTYKNLEIQKGDVAQKRYQEMIGLKDQIEKQRVSTALLEYCKMDTLAMVRILQKLFVIVGNPHVF